jgi:RHS repeat-associated protein
MGALRLTYQNRGNFYLSSKKSVSDVCSSLELSNHLGNVLSVISDKPIPHPSGSTVAYYKADILQSQDYSPFGVKLKGRNLNKDLNVEFYRSGFQGQEEDDELKGDGNSLNYEFRMHDPRLGRFFAGDPLESKYPFYSPYAFSGNEVISKVELEGLEPADNKLKQSNVGKTFIALSHATGQEGKSFYWTLETCAGAIFWEQGNRYTAPKPKPVEPVQSEAQTLENNKWASALKLEKTLNGYAAESWNAGNYWDAFTWKIKAWDSGLEGDVGFKRKGIPLMAGTVSTVLTFGSGSLFSGAVTSGVSNGAGNFFGQWAQTGDIKKVDVLSVGLAGFGGMIKNPWISLGTTSTVDAAFDVKASNGVSVIGTDKKSWTAGAVDFGFSIGGGTQGNLLQKAGVNQTVLNRRSIIIGGMQQYGNGVTNDKLENQGTTKTQGQ